MSDFESHQKPASMNHNNENQNARVTLSTPVENQNHIVTVTQGLQIVADFDFGNVAIEKVGQHLVFHFSQGGRITLENINSLIESGHSPTIMLQDGSVLSADQILATISTSEENEVEPAAGESVQASGGVSEYEDSPGTILDGVDRLDGLGFAQTEGPVTPDIEAVDQGLDGPSQLGGTRVDSHQPSIVIDDLGLSNDNTPVITGSAESGSTVIIEVGGVTMATTADGAGHWSVTVPDGSPLPDGSFTITGTAINNQGHFDTATGGLVIDTTIVADISLDGNITAEDVSNAVESDGYIAVTGTVGGDVADGDTVTVTVNGNTYTGQVSGSAFSIDVPGRDFADAADQTIDAIVTTTDAAGNTTTAIDIQTYGDGGEFTLPSPVDGPTASITLSQNITTDDIINSSESGTDIAISGVVGGDVADGDIVTVTVNGNTYTGQVSGGTFMVDVAGSDLAADSGHTIQASVTTVDAAGNSDTATDTESYGVDTMISASITLDAQITDDDVINASESGTDIAINGTVGGDVVDGDTVTLTVNGSIYTGQVSGGGFSIDVAGSDLVADGDRTIEASVTTTDAAGNSVTATDTESYGVDTMISASITLDTDITDDDVINASESGTDIAISGTVGGDVADGDTVTLTVNGSTYTGQVSGGAFSIDVAGSDLAADGDHTIEASVTTTDAAGNSATATDTESYEVDTQVSASITLDAQITDDDVINASESGTDIAISGSVGGDVVDGDTVTLTVNGNTYTGQVSGGAFSIDVAGSDLAADGDYTIEAGVTTTDAAGNSVTATDSESYDVVLGFDTEDDFENTRPSEAVEIDVLANDSGDELQLVSVSVDGGDHVGTASIVDGKVLFQPSTDLVGSPDAPDSVTLTYTATDAYGNVETGDAQVQTGIFHDEADYAFDSFITESSSGDLLTASVDLTEGQGDASLSASLYPESSTTFDIEITVDKSVVEPNIDTYFLQDLTGSFYDDLDNITTDADGNGVSTLEEMVQVFEAKSGHSAYGTGTFVDTANGDGDAAHRQFMHGVNIADSGDGAANAGVLQSQYDGYVASGGADYPESQFYAIKEIAEAIIKANGGNEELGISSSTDPAETFGFTAGSNPVVVLSTDAISHGYLAEDTDRFGTDPNLSGIMEMYAYVEASGMQLVVLAADLVSGNMGAVTFWNDVLNGTVANADSGWSGGAGVYNTHESFETDQSINGYVAELNTDSSNIVSALQKAVDNIEFTSPLSLVTDSGDSTGGNETDDFSYTSLTDGTFVENSDGTFTQTWTVELQAPVGGADDPKISFVVTDGDGNPIGETVNVDVTVADGGQITGTEHFDTLIGTDTLSDTMFGQAGDDRLDGRDGSDTLDGGAGNDILVGGEGDDLLIGGLDDDTMTGASGADTFVFSANAGEGHDSITDFNVDTDVIRLTDVLDAEGDHDIDINDLLHDGGQNVSASVTGADVELTISHGGETTVVTLAGINATHNFDGDTTLSDLINHGLQIDPM